MKVDSELKGYIALQRLLDRRTMHRRDHDTLPEALQTLRSRFSERHERLAAASQRQASLADERTRLESEVGALREEREHFKRQRSHVTNMKQYSAVVSELDTVETQLKAKEERLVQVVAELETTDEELARLSQETPEERDVREHAETDWAGRRATIAIELAALREQMAHLKQELGPTAWARFERLWKSRKPAAVAPLEVSSDGQEWSCSFCHASLRPSLVQLVKGREDFATCDTCRRVLFDPDQYPD